MSEACYWVLCMWLVGGIFERNSLYQERLYYTSTQQVSKILDKRLESEKVCLDWNEFLHGLISCDCDKYKIPHYGRFTFNLLYKKLNSYYDLNNFILLSFLLLWDVKYNCRRWSENSLVADNIIYCWVDTYAWLTLWCHGRCYISTMCVYIKWNLVLKMPHKFLHDLKSF